MLVLTSGPAGGWLERMVTYLLPEDCSAPGRQQQRPSVGTCSLCVPMTGDDVMWLDDATAADGLETRPGSSGSSVVLEFDRG